MCLGPEIFTALKIGAGTASTLSTVASVGLGVLQGVSALGSIQEGRAQSAALEQQATAQQQLAEYNAAVARNEGIMAQRQADLEQERLSRQRQVLRGSQRAAIAASGGEILDAGDFLDMTEEEAELDALAIRYGAQTAQRAAQQRADLARMQGTMLSQQSRAQARQARSQGLRRAGGTLLTGASSITNLGGFRTPTVTPPTSLGGIGTI